jgi:hypothetical protein
LYQSLFRIRISLFKVANLVKQTNRAPVTGLKGGGMLQVSQADVLGTIPYAEVHHMFKGLDENMVSPIREYSNFQKERNISQLSILYTVTILYTL